ncbi:glycosyltransferase family 2 protein [soil metagenome]
MISIITSVYNQLDMNKLFYETLKKNTSLPFELIVIDNDSNDGTREFFRNKADVLITNEENFSYPYCQNQGIRAAKFEYLAFFNNDILVSKNWDKKILRIMDEKEIDIISFATNDHLENKKVQRKLHKKWKRIKYTLRALFGTRINTLRWMVKLTYGNFDKFCEDRFEKFKDEVIEGFSGSCILIKKWAIEKIGLWDERMQVADFDLFFRTKERWLQHHDVKPIQLALGVYIHHFQRLTLRSKNLVPFADQQNLISLEEKWGDKVETLFKDVIG